MKWDTTILLLIVIALLAIAAVFRALRTPVRHRWRRRQAKAMAIQLQGRDRDQPAQLIFGRLRAMDPLTFEELLLDCFERRGLTVWRNRRYSGDGGIDGRLVIGGETVLIQAKRYSSAIRPEHVSAFVELCASSRCRGVFIHTGRTGPQSRLQLPNNASVTIVSGAELVALLRGDTVACLAGSGNPPPSPRVLRQSKGQI
jgi:restriction system protein